MDTIKGLRAALYAHKPHLSPHPLHTRAAVAVLLHPRAEDVYVLFIERASHPRDPWSGHLAFPGGTSEPRDADLRATAERETMEELGVDPVDHSGFLGRLDDVIGATFPISVSGFVYALDRRIELQPNPDEVREAYWIPFSHLVDPARRRVLRLCDRGPMRETPALDLLGPSRPLLWGLTYRMVVQLAFLAGYALPETTRPKSFNA